MKRKKVGSKTALTTVKIIVLVFLSIILLGGILLSLPFANRNQESLALIDALFTATSAVCVTGLTTVNVAAQFSLFGQLIIMLLIQVGGLGYMSIVVMIALMAGKRVSLKSRLVIKDMLNIDNPQGMVKLMLFIIKLSLSIQLIGALILMTAFVPQYGWAKGVFFSLFHAVSAFCNAGFDLFGTSLSTFQNQPVVLLTIAGLIISGGLGFIVWSDILQFKSFKRYSLHTKMALSVTGSLLLFGVVIFTWLQTSRGQSYFSEMNWLDRLANALFLSVTPRTAGFYTIDYATMSYTGILVTLFLMFIGGTSGSTAGGIKVTTLGVLLVQLFSTFKGRQEAEIGYRQIPTKTVMKGLFILFLSTASIFVVTLILSMTEAIPYQSGIEYILFEVISAFATVGLTMGLTPDLTVFGKIVIMLMMFVGRVGLYTVMYAIMTKGINRGGQPKYQYPKESVMIG